MNMLEEYKGFYEHEWFNGFMNRVNFVHRKIFPVESDGFIVNEDGPQVENSIITSEIQLDTRFAYNEKYVFGEFDRVSLGTKYPVLEARLGYGIPDFLN